MIYDVIIIGSGVAGSTAAYFLAESGFKTLIIEKEKLPRYKTCGGGVVFRAAQKLPFALTPVTEKVFYTTDIYDAKNNLHFAIERRKPIVYMTMRNSLDHFILNKAIEMGAIVRDESVFEEVIPERDYLTIKCNNEIFKTRFMISSDGALGTKEINSTQPGSGMKIPALEYETEVNNKELFSKLSQSPRFDFGILEEGYCWVFPKMNHLSIGIAAMRKSNSSLKNYLDKYFKMLGINSVACKIERHGFVIPIRPVKKFFTEKRILLAGDKAGLADPITAEGISNAIDSGKSAAAAITEGNLDAGKVAFLYQKKIELITEELKYARFLAWFVYSSPAIRSFVFKHYGNKIGELLTDVILNEKKYKEIVTNPANYLKLLKPEYFFRRK